MNEIHPDETGQNRRSFLKNGLIICAGSGGILWTKGTGVAAEPEKRWGMIIDFNRCMGCHTCTVSCKLQNNTIDGKFSTSVKEEERGNTLIPDSLLHLSNATSAKIHHALNHVRKGQHSNFQTELS